MTHGLNCSATRGNFLDQRIEATSLALAGRFLTTEPRWYGCVHQLYGCTTVYGSTTECIISPVDERLNCFIVTSAVMNIHVQVFPWTYTFISLEWMELLSLMVNFCLTF